MPTTSNRGYSTPVTTDLATIPAHLKLLADPIDADIQTLFDRQAAREDTVITHHGGGVWAVTTGLGTPIPVNDLGDGTYSIGA